MYSLKPCLRKFFSWRWLIKILIFTKLIWLLNLNFVIVWVALLLISSTNILIWILLYIWFTLQECINESLLQWYLKSWGDHLLELLTLDHKINLSYLELILWTSSLLNKSCAIRFHILIFVCVVWDILAFKVPLRILVLLFISVWLRETSRLVGQSFS